MVDIFNVCRKKSRLGCIHGKSFRRAYGDSKANNQVVKSFSGIQHPFAVITGESHISNYRIWCRLMEFLHDSRRSCWRPPKSFLEPLKGDQHKTKRTLLFPGPLDSTCWTHYQNFKKKTREKVSTRTDWGVLPSVYHENNFKNVFLKWLSQGRTCFM